MASGSRVGNIASTLYTIVLYIYLLPIMFVFGPYYNWQYAQEHGFTSWLFLGEIVPTAQSIIWPYYVYKHYTKPPGPVWTEQENDNARHIASSMHAFFAAIEITNANKTGNFSDADVKSIRQLMTTALSEAQQVTDAVLDKIHPDFKRHFRNEYQKSLELRIQSIDEKDELMEKQAMTLAQKWGDWLKSHSEEIDIRNK